MIDGRMLRQLNVVAARWRQVRLWSCLAVVLLASAVVSGSLLWISHWQGTATAGAVTPIMAITGCAVIAALALSLRRGTDYRQIATRIERHYPDLKCALLTAVEQQPELPRGQYGYLQQQVIEQVVTHGFRNRWSKSIPTSRLVLARLAAMLAAIVLTVTLAGLRARRSDAAASASSQVLPQTEHAATRFDVTVEPGDVEIEHRRDLLVLARFAQSPRSEVTLVYESESGQQHRLPMRQNLQDPEFGARIPSINGPLTYHVAYADQESDRYAIRVFRYPELERADAQLSYPSFTAMPDRLVLDVRHLSAVEGTELTLLCQLNKEVESAELVDAEGAVIALDPDATNAKLVTASWVVSESKRWQLRLRDAEGRENQYPPRFVINVLPNRLPDLQIGQPAGDRQVSPLEEMHLQASAWDDFGLHRLGISFSLTGFSSPGLSVPGMAQHEIVLRESVAAKTRAEAEHTIFFEAMAAQPDQLLAYHFWAEDLGPRGIERRVSSDLYFAEVRHFEEIFRQGKQPTTQQQNQQLQGQPGSAGQTQGLAELQKQIIGGTWKVMRRAAFGTKSESTARKNTPEKSREKTEEEIQEYIRETIQEPIEQNIDGNIEETNLLLLAQQSAVVQLAALAQEVEDSESLAHIDTVRQAMDSAVEQLQAAHEASTAGPSTGDLPSTLGAALAAEQTAYQGLLKLRAHEFQVVRSRQRKSSGASDSSQQKSNNRSQQRLEQLQLEQDDNRYEEQRLAQSRDESPLDRENRQILNRLRELARRQNDLNERIKQLQSELQAVEGPTDRDELRRQLKRLRDQQEEILRDSDELASRMTEQQNQEPMAEQQQQLESAREQAQRTSAALAAGQVSQAAASGSRTEQELSELREVFRRRLSRRFQEQMRDMQQAAEDLDQRQSDISERLASLPSTERPEGSLEADPRRLDDDSDQETLLQRLEHQKQHLGEIFEEMKDVVEEAETSEPLLAQQLYDTYRRSQQQDLAETLRSTQRSLDRGLVDDAQLQQRRASEAIHDLRAGIQRAAESVLGDDTEALRRARDELSRLTRQLDQEIARNDGGPADRAAGQDRHPRPLGEPSPNGQPNQRTNQQPSDRSDPSNVDSQGRPGARPNGPAGRDSPAQRFADEPRSQPNRLQPTAPMEDPTSPLAPIAGDDFLDWSDRLRDVEEMIDDPQLRAEAARVRDRARGIRKKLKRHSQPPNWQLVKASVLEPLVELQQQVHDELLRRTAKETLVPIDRDPVPPSYAEQIRLYYERLGRGR